jgi:hypothetical protein
MLCDAQIKNLKTMSTNSDNPASAQDSRSPQDETPDLAPSKRQKQSAPGKSPKNEKPKPVQRKQKNSRLLSDDADIHDETTI